MNNRSRNMKRVSVTRSAEVAAMLDLLRDLDEGSAGDLEGFKYYGIKDSYKMKNRINSYRAQKIANKIGKNISKSHLVKFSKDKNLLLESDLAYNNKERLSINDFLNMNGAALIRYYSVIKSLYINDALLKLDN